MITYNGLTPSAPIKRGYWRVVLKGGFWDVKPWPDRVDSWRSGVNAGELDLAAAASPAAATEGGAFQTERAVVDVQVIEADPTRTVEQIADTMNGLRLGVDVQSVDAVNNSDPVARAAALAKAKAAAETDPLDRLVRAISTLVKVGVAIAAVYAVAQLVKAYKSK